MSFLCRGVSQIAEQPYYWGTAYSRLSPKIFCGFSSDKNYLNKNFYQQKFPDLQYCPILWTPDDYTIQARWYEFQKLSGKVEKVMTSINCMTQLQNF